MPSARETAFYLLLFVFLTVGAYVDGKEVGLKTAFGIPRQNSTQCQREYSCASCNQVRICSQHGGAWQEKTVFACSSSTPYCDYTSGTCSSEPSLECAPKDDFLCMRDGTFPDPSDCKLYHVCYNFTSYQHNCSGYNNNYDSDKEACVYRATCYKFDCSAKNGVKTAYAHDSSIFAYCVNGTVYSVDRCPGNYQLSYSNQTCLPKCDSERLSPDVDDCTKYYKCSMNSSYDYTLTHERCPDGEGFDPVYSRCVFFPRFQNADKHLSRIHIGHSY